MICSKIKKIFVNCYRFVISNGKNLRKYARIQSLILYVLRILHVGHCSPIQKISGCYFGSRRAPNGSWRPEPWTPDNSSNQPMAMNVVEARKDYIKAKSLHIYRKYSLSMHLFGYLFKKYLENLKVVYT